MNKGCCCFESRENGNRLRRNLLTILWRREGHFMRNYLDFGAIGCHRDGGEYRDPHNENMRRFIPWNENPVTLVIYCFKSFRKNVSFESCFSTSLDELNRGKHLVSTRKQGFDNRLAGDGRKAHGDRVIYHDLLDTRGISQLHDIVLKILKRSLLMVYFSSLSSLCSIVLRKIPPSMTFRKWLSLRRVIKFLIFYIGNCEQSGSLTSSINVRKRKRSSDKVKEKKHNH